MFRESIGLFITEERAKLYVPKNTGLNEYVNNLLRVVGVKDNGEFERTGQADGRLEILSARGEDVPQRVDDCILRGDVAYGLTGDDLFDEYMLGAHHSPLGVLNTYDWFDPDAQFNRPALCLLNRPGKLPDSALTVSIAVNKKYERTSRRYLLEKFGSGDVQFNVVPYAGDTENTVSEGTHDWCVEVVYRGEKSAESAIDQGRAEGGRDRTIQRHLSDRKGDGKPVERRVPTYFSRGSKSHGLSHFKAIGGSQ